MIKRFSKRTWVVIAVVLAVAMSAIGAFAYWTTTGSGSGTASTGTTAGLTVNQTSVVTGLYPGGPSVALSGTFTNTNAGPAYVGAVTGSVTATSNQPACNPADFVIGGTAPVNANVPSGTGVGSWSGLDVSMTNTGSNQDACKNANITITYASN